MESANHEFTWLSGRAHLSVAQEAQCHDQSQPPKSKPTPLPRQHTIGNEQLPTEKSVPSKPTPVPRIFRRPTFSSPIYDVPPTLQSSVFYVATPKTVDGDDTQRTGLTALDKSVILEFDPILQRSDSGSRQSAVFYVDVDTSEVPTLPVGSSVNSSSPCPESHFQSHNNSTGSSGHQLTPQVTSGVSNSESEREFDSAASEFDVPQSSAAERVTLSNSAASSLSKSSTLSSSSQSSLTAGKVRTPDRGLLSCVPPAPASYLESVPKQPTPESETVSRPANGSPEIGDVLIKEATKGDKMLTDMPNPEPGNLPESTASHVPQVSDIPTPVPPRRPVAKLRADAMPKTAPHHSDTVKAPVPQPRFRTAPIAPHPAEHCLPPDLPACKLSTVPPPPSQQPTASSSSQPGRVPIQVENPFYMFFQAGSALEQSSTGRRQSLDSNSDSSGSGSDSDTSNEGYGPPQFPPPPPPPGVDETDTDTTTKLPDDLVIDKTEPVLSSTLESKPRGDCPPRFSPPNENLGTSACVPQTLIDVPQTKQESPAHSGRELPKPGFPVYHNLIEVYKAQEGVYAKIHKAAMPSPEAPNLAPPPLPPRGQQRPPPPRLSQRVSPTVTPPPSVAKDDSPLARQSVSRHDTLSVEFSAIPHHGVLFRIGRGRKDVVQKWIVLDRGSLQCYADDKMEGPQEVFHKSDLLSVAKGTGAKYCSNQELFCFEVVTRYCKDRPQVLGARYLSECDSWIERIVQTIAPPSVAMTSGRGILKAGHIQMRNSVTGLWQEGWVVLRDRQLEFSLKDEASLTLDLRKIISLQGFEKDSRMNESDEDPPTFVINYPAVTLYVRTLKVFDTAKWFSRIEQAMLNKGPSLDEQQMTHDGVPVIVDKCIKFVSTYGMTSKGLYRQSSTNSRIAKLLESLRKDAHKVHLQPDDYSEHDVANALKRFLRTLPDALLTKALYMQWIASVGNFNIEHVKGLLGRLPEVNYRTLKRLIAHLYSVSERSDQNLMSVTNLAQVFGSTLMSTESDINIANAHHEMELMSYLIANYPQLFGVSAEEIEKEEKIQKALKDLREAKKAQKPAGDILVGIYVYNRHWGKCLNMKLAPSMTALDICKLAVQQTRIKDAVQSLAVFEVVCNENLERPLHHSEIVLSVTLRWACWADADARDNYLVIRKNEICQRVLPLARQPLSMFGELRFADIKSKSFKKFMFEFKNARLAYYKDAKISQPLGSWNIEDITWYIGAEHRRHAPSKWAMTFIEQNASVKTRTKENNYFGHTVCFSIEEEFHKWVATLLVGQYPNGILPKIEPIDLLR